MISSVFKDDRRDQVLESGRLQKVVENTVLFSSMLSDDVFQAFDCVCYEMEVTKSHHRKGFVVKGGREL